MVAAQGQSGLDIDETLPGDDPDVEDKRKLSDIRIDAMYKKMTVGSCVYGCCQSAPGPLQLNRFNHINHSMKVYHSPTR